MQSIINTGIMSVTDPAFFQKIGTGIDISKRPISSAAQTAVNLCIKCIYLCLCTIAGSCFLFAARLLIFCSDRFWLFAVEAVAEGIASALFSGTFSAYLYEVEPQDFAENLSKNDNCSNLGFILSSLGFFVLYAYGGIDSLLFFTMLFSFAALVCSFFLKPVGAKPCPYVLPMP